MSRQFLRKASLVVGGGSGGGGLDLSQLRFKFTVKKGDLQTPNTCDIRVYNVSDETASRVQREFSRVILQAGYEDNFGVIFDGNIKQVRRGRENATDTYLDLLVADGDMAYNFAVVNTTLAAGAGQAEQVKAAQQAMQQMGVSAGYTPDLGGQQLARGKVMYGMARDYLRDSAESTDTSWSIQDGRLQMVPMRGVLPGAAVVLTAKTGLVGMPEQTNDGIKAKCLLNPQLRIGARVQINNTSIQRAKINVAYTAINMIPRVADDGFYRVLIAEHQGDTRGQDWYTTLVCLALDDTVPQSMAVKGYS